MGLFDGFRKKKEEFNTNPDYGMPLQGQDQGTPYPAFGQGGDFNAQDPYATPGAQQDPYAQPGMGQDQYSASQSFPDQGQQPFSPEQAGFERMPSGQPSYPSGRAQNISDITTSKEFELINAKLDALKSELDSISQRLKRIERLQEGTGTGKHDAWY